MKILITGASGIIGQELSYYLSANYKVYGTYRKTKPKMNGNIIWKKIELKKKIYWKINPDIIINCVVTSKYSKNSSAQDFINSNIIALKNICDFGNKVKVKLIINLSTISIYRNNKKILNEYSSINVDDDFALTKYFGEKILETNSSNFINLRLPAILNLNLNKNHSWINSLAQKLKKNKNVTVFNGNEKFNSVIHIKQLFYLIEKLINVKKKIVGTFNFAPKKGEKLKNIVLYLKECFGSNSKIRFIKSNKISPYISSQKIFNHIKLTLPTTMSIIKDTFNKN